jgi:hypothetical protein
MFPSSESAFSLRPRRIAAACASLMNRNAGGGQAAISPAPG